MILQCNKRMGAQSLAEARYNTVRKFKAATLANLVETGLPAAAAQLIENAGAPGAVQPWTLAELSPPFAANGCMLSRTRKLSSCKKFHCFVLGNPISLYSSLWRERIWRVLFKHFPTNADNLKMQSLAIYLFCSKWLHAKQDEKPLLVQEILPFWSEPPKNYILLFLKQLTLRVLFRGSNLCEFSQLSCRPDKSHLHQAHADIKSRNKQSGSVVIQ